jgi:hypothetical protein
MRSESLRHGCFDQRTFVRADQIMRFDFPQMPEKCGDFDGQ